MKEKKHYSKLILLAGMFILLVVLDQVTKFLAVTYLKGNTGMDVIKNILSFEYLENHGAAWGILSGKTIFLLVITIAFAILLFGFIIQIEKALKKGIAKVRLYTIVQTVLVLLMAGAIGNFIDRWRLSYVIDFIKVEFIEFPVFNVADCYVVVSSFILIFIVIFFMKDDDFENFEKTGM